MSDSNHHNEEERYFNDPEYRKKLKEKRAKKKNSRSDDGKNGNEHQSEYSTKFFSLKNKPPFPWKDLGKWVGILILACLILGAGFFVYLYQGIPSIQQLENPKVDVASVVKTRDGVVLDKYFSQNRTYVPLSRISPNVVHALIATEDHRFYHHWGIDMFRTLSIPYHILMGNPQGGSTITQQLARNLYRKIGRKIFGTKETAGNDYGRRD